MNDDTILELTATYNDDRILKVYGDKEFTDLSVLIRHEGQCAVISLETDQAVKLAHTILKQVL